MKISKFKLTLLLVSIVSLNSFATEIKTKHEETKKISKTYEVNKNAQVTLNNKFGDMDISTWDKNTVEINVEIKVSGSNSKKVKEAIDRIEIELSGSSSVVSAITQFNNSSRNWNNNLNFEVNYMVKMPKSNDLTATNDYGTLILNELDGMADLECDYGKVIIGSLNHEGSRINMDYTNNSSIEYMKSGSIDADYSDLSVTRAEKIELNADYTNLEFDQIKTLNFNVDYGKVSIGKGGRIVGDSDYTNIRIDYLVSGLELNCDYGGIKVDRVDQKFEWVKVKTKYTSVKLGMSEKSEYTFDLNLRYGSFDYNHEDLFEFKQKIKDNNKRQYVGSFNGGGTAKVFIETSYGDIDFY